MMTWIGLVLAIAIAGVVLERLHYPGAHLIGALSGFILVYAVAWIGWWALLYFHIVPLHWPEGRNDIEPFWMRWTILGPPLLPAAIFFLVHFFSRQSHDRNSTNK